MITIEDFIDETINQIINGINKVNDSYETLGVQMPPKIDFDLAIITKDGINYVACENEISNTRLKITVDTLRYPGGKKLYGAK